MKKHKPLVIEELVIQCCLSDGSFIDKVFTGRKLEKIVENNPIFNKLVDEV
jgi:hypothetical protein